MFVVMVLIDTLLDRVRTSNANFCIYLLSFISPTRDITFKRMGIYTKYTNIFNQNDTYRYLPFRVCKNLEIYTPQFY